MDTALPSRCSGQTTTRPWEASDPARWEYVFRLPPRPCENITVGHRLFDVPGRPASLVRRFGLSGVQKLGPLKDRFMAEARGESGPRPRLLTGELV